jgi:hypothetical protein
LAHGKQFKDSEGPLGGLDGAITFVADSILPISGAGLQGRTLVEPAHPAST